MLTVDGIGSPFLEHLNKLRREWVAIATPTDLLPPELNLFCFSIYFLFEVLALDKERF